MPFRLFLYKINYTSFFPDRVLVLLLPIILQRTQIPIIVIAEFSRPLLSGGEAEWDNRWVSTLAGHGGGFVLYDREKHLAR